MRGSIHFRLLLAATLVLAAFLGLAGVALERAFHNSGRAALREALLGTVYALLAAAGEDPEGGLRMPESLPDPRLNRPDSGLLAAVEGLKGPYHWRSGSTFGRELKWPRPRIEPGRPVYGELRDPEGRRYALVQFAILWETDGGEQPYLISVAQDLEGFETGQVAFRHTLWLWLAAVAVLLLLVQGGVLRWGLRPLRQVSEALGEVQAGRAERLEGEYPVELRGLTESINAFIEASQRRQTRYRHSLDDLAHSLKTPLAVLQGALEADREPHCDGLRHTLKEQLGRMQAIVARQLQRAAAGGGGVLARSVAVRPLVERLVASLQKVYRERGLEVALEIPQEARFRGDETDLMEIFGNLLDNAFKHARRRVGIEVEERDGWLQIRIDDDGPGIPEGMRQEVLQRGIRGDVLAPGQGIGLAAAQEIVSAYRGALELDANAGGGVRVRVRLPLTL